MKILLVYPSSSKGLTWLWCPLGLPYIGAVLEKDGHEVKGVDLRCQSFDEYTGILKSWNPDYIGVFTETVCWDDAKLTIKTAKELCDAKVIAGGPHSTINPKEVISTPVDIVVVGEGEETVKEIVSGKPLNDVQGIFYKQGDIIKSNPKREPIKDLDAIPFPNREIFPIKEYLKSSYFLFPLPGPNLHLIAGRGCPFNCKFCQPTVRMMFGSGIRYRSVSNVIDEIKFLVEKYKLQGYHFQDDILTLNKKWTLSFCNAIVNEKLNDIPWACQSRSDTLDEERVKALKKAGCISLWFGFESGSQRILEYYNKLITVEQSKNVVKLCKENGIIILTGLMVGAPYETVEDLNLTYKLFKETDPEIAWVAITSPYVGTYLYDECLKNGLLLVNEDYSNFDRVLATPKMKTVTPMETIKTYRDVLERRLPSFRLYVKENYYRKAINKWLGSIFWSGKMPWFMVKSFGLLMKYWAVKSNIIPRR